MKKIKGLITSAQRSIMTSISFICAKLSKTKVIKKTVELNGRREFNTEKYKVINLLLLVLFPLFITTLAEMIHMKSPAKFIVFLFESPSIVLFNIILCSLFYVVLLGIFKKGWAAAGILGLTYVVLSIVELFKFNTSGNHLILTDMKLAVNINQLKSFAYIKITPGLVAFVLIFFVYFAAMFYFNPIIKFGRVKRVFASGLSLATIVITLVNPSIATPVYSAFDIQTTNSDNVFRVNEKFDNNSLLAFLAQTTTEFLNRKVVVPSNYSPESIDSILADVEVEDENGEFIKPNVIMIMSEAFADFRMFDELDEYTDGIYDSFDRIREQGYSGKAVVPAFGSFTVKTEFELLFGLPVKSLNDPNMPQRLLLDRDQQTIPRYYKSLGYNTNYIHPFTRTFYGRSKIYANYGFDNMYFNDNLTVDIKTYEAYISDTTIFDQIEKVFDETDEPTFVHTTTMQNHQPYHPDDRYPTQLEYYLAGVKDMLGNLETFLNNLDEPTVVFFVGDHFPSFKGEESIYNTLNINSENCSDLYQQEFFIWDNFGADYSDLPDEPISAFYAPYLVMDVINAPMSNVATKMYDKMSALPIYTTNYDDTILNDEEIDTITYDIAVGDQYIDEDLN